MSLKATVSQSWSESDAVVVANVTAVNPTLTLNASELFTDAYRITLKGRGFDEFRTNNNTVTFQTASTAPEVKGLAEIFHNISRNLFHTSDATRWRQ